MLVVKFILGTECNRYKETVYLISFQWTFTIWNEKVPPLSLQQLALFSSKFFTSHLFSYHFFIYFYALIEQSDEAGESGIQNGHHRNNGQKKGVHTQNGYHGQHNNGLSVSKKKAINGTV